MAEENIARVVRRRGLEATGSHVSKPEEYLAQYVVYGASKSSILKEVSGLTVAKPKYAYPTHK